MKKEDLNKVLVKRVVPHQMALTFEHDFGPYTDYRPIVRIHKKGITGGDGFNTASDKLQFLYFIRSKKQDRNDDVFNSDINLRNEQDKIQGLKNKNEFIRTILKNMQSNRLPYNKPVKVTDDMIKSNLLRNLNVEPPPGGMSAVPEAPKNIKWLPKYPFWNYWTYKKTIYQDECPGNQIAMGDLCVWVPPH
ncbi:uncharacterized protein [Battus philenor]|uniref:uncharacterized protein n=1 Tax=Battus philenor TaxID=42288 RepID=UPI0035CE980F